MSTAHVPTPQPSLFKPVLLRGIVSLVFGVATVFAPDLAPVWRGVGTGAFLILSAVGIFWLARLAQPVLPFASRMLTAQSAVLVIAGVLEFFLLTDAAYQILSVLTLLVAGIIELVLGLRHRRGTVLGRDWLIVGAVWIIGAIILAVIGHASYRAPIGVLGGVAVITGVVLVLAALSYRHDAGTGPSATAPVAGRQGE